MGEQHLFCGRIIKATAGFYYVSVPERGIYQCRAKGAFRKAGHSPLVGDIVDIRLTATQDVEGNVERIHPRSSVLSRPSVANVDGVLVVFALKDPVPNLLHLDRILVSIEQEDLPAVICFNKSDITDDEPAKELAAIYAGAGYTVLVTSAKTHEGVDEVRQRLAGKLFTVAGPSGAGKSSLINCLQNDIVMETGEVSKKIGRGKQTTRHIELVAVDRNSYIVDTPGFGAVSVPDMKPLSLAACFPEMAGAEEKCRFRGCAHIDEPDCEVKRLTEEGRIAASRYESYRILYQELLDKGKRKY
ncbi:MAG: ribosome small subunit-dependent GTPase A [Lachnospiraceae bacterium]|nr:ribosome small subunit-dependent GTPase A [Lachnospiraceae bacterium]